MSGSQKQNLSLPLHDWLSLGLVEQAIEASQHQEQQVPPGTTDIKIKQDEVDRLPLFLRWLHTITKAQKNSTRKHNSATESNEGEDEEETLPQRVAEGLEYVAASHPSAEGVDVVTNYLVPHLTKGGASNLRSLSKTLLRTPGGQAPKGIHSYQWDTRELKTLAKNPVPIPRSGRRKRRKSGKSASGEGEGDSNEDGDNSDHSSFVYDEDSTEDMEVDEEYAEPARKKRKVKDSDDVFEAKEEKEAAQLEHMSHLDNRMEGVKEDSQVGTVTKVLGELCKLVVESLEQQSANTDLAATAPSSKMDPEDRVTANQQVPSHGETSDVGLALTMDESSILADPYALGGASNASLEGSDLGAILVAILHHAPALHHKHLSAALCRACIPQTGLILTRLGANCPTAVPALLMGCIDSYRLASSQGNRSIILTSKLGVKALAELSPREKARVLHKLQALHIMMDIQMDLSLDEALNCGQPTAAACSLILHLSQPFQPRHTTTPNQHLSPLQRPSGVSRQAAGDPSAESSRGQHLSSRSRGYEELETFLQSSSGYDKVVLWFKQRFAVFQGDKQPSIGQQRLLYKAYAWFLVAVSPNPEASLAHIGSNLSSLAAFWLAQKGTKTESATPSSPLWLLQICVTIFSCCRFSSEEFSPDRVKTISQVLEHKASSHEESEFVATLWSCESCLKACSMLLGPLLGERYSTALNLDMLDDSFQRGFSQTCMKIGCTITQPIPPTDSVQLLSLPAMLQSLDSLEEHTDGFLCAVHTTLAAFLGSEDNMVEPLRLDTTTNFVSKATQVLSGTGRLKVPLVLSTALQRLQLKASFDLGHGIGENEARFVIHFLHCFEYRDANPDSPFAFDPRDFSLRKMYEAIASSENLALPAASVSLHNRFKELMAKHSKEVLGRINTAQSLVESMAAPKIMQHVSLERKDVQAKLFQVITEAKKGPTSSQNSHMVEETFQYAQNHLTLSDLCTTVTSSFMAKPNTPPPAVQFSQICRDPLVLFHCPKRTWKNRGLRRILLSVLELLLDTNANIVQRQAPMQGTARQLLAVRDAIVVRCLLTVVADCWEGSCFMVTSMVRLMVRRHSGLAASLVRQGLPQTSTDWLIENVPECINDADHLISLLTERSFPTLADRLIAADIVLRIAILHGQDHQNKAASMAYVALSQLIDAFFLVVGPIGVPVSALVVDGTGQDVTQLARKAAHRIIKSLHNVRGRHKLLRKECGLALQKIASLCKAEGGFGNVPKSVSGRRKAFLKDMFDAVLKAATSMGYHIGYQSSAA